MLCDVAKLLVAAESLEAALDGVARSDQSSVTKSQEDENACGTQLNARAE